jgi:hypothetical protein
MTSPLRLRKLPAISFTDLDHCPRSILSNLSHESHDTHACSHHGDTNRMYIKVLLTQWIQMSVAYQRYSFQHQRYMKYWNEYCCDCYHHIDLDNMPLFVRLLSIFEFYHSIKMSTYPIIVVSSCHAYDTIWYLTCSYKHREWCRCRHK